MVALFLLEHVHLGYILLIPLLSLRVFEFFLVGQQAVVVYLRMLQILLLVGQQAVVV
jgi:hypothetical protein